jgi:Ca-activated chloride channel family protein
LARQPGYGQVTVTIVDQRGRYVTGLQKNDFKLYIDGQQRPIEFFRQDLNTPVSVGILVDTSGSMEPKLAQARAAITEFVDDLNPRDDVFLFAFSSQPFLLQPFTTDHQAVIGRLNLLYAQGETAIFDTIIDGLLMVRHGRWDKKALLVVTDGQDNASAESLERVIGLARQQGVLIYSIGIGNSNIAPTAGLGPLSPLGLGFMGENDEVDARTLETLSNETGAKTYMLRTIGDGRAMRDDCAAISRELREQYTLGFVAPDPTRSGYRDVRVAVPNRPYDNVRVRKGVEIGGTESASADPYAPAP